jgi:hypothetical protein
MTPIFAYNKKLKKWEIFPYDQLETLPNGKKGFDSKYWAEGTETATEAITMIKYYSKHFVKRPGSQWGYAYHYLFVGDLPKLERLKYKALEKLYQSLEIIPQVIAGTMIVGLIMFGLVSMAVGMFTVLNATYHWIVG